MSDLDKKLRDARSTTVHVNGLKIELVTFYIENLRKLIADEVEDGRKGLMSGQEWYKKFEKELSGGGKRDDVLWSSLYYTGKRKFDNEQYREVEAVVLRAAKKSAGIE